MEKSTEPEEHDLGSRLRGSVASVFGAVGEGLLTLGILVTLFLVWEVWWTDVVGSRHQQDIVNALDWAVPAVPACELAGVCPSSTEDADPGPVYPAIQEDDREREAPPPSETVPGAAETFATLYVPRWGADYIRPISEGVGRRSVLDKLGIGHYPNTTLPGGWGNFAVAGHRTTFGKPFERIEELQIGDTIVVRTESAWYVYRITETHIVRPSFDAAIAPVPGEKFVEPNGRYITLTTCHPKYSASQRYVVYGVLDYWAYAWAGYPPEILSGEEDAADAMAVAERGGTP
ncbi:MAG: class E sortase [Demequinaceae bacterium]|nr:class E sortase [Demequinaceae bacterium]